METVWQWLMDPDNLRLIIEIFGILGGLTGWRLFLVSVPVLDSVVDAIEAFSKHHSIGKHLKNDFIAPISKDAGADKTLKKILVKKKYSRSGNQHGK